VKKISVAFLIVGLFIAVFYIGLRKAPTPPIVSRAVQPSQSPAALFAISQFPVYPAATLVRAVTIPDKTVHGYGERYQAVWSTQVSVPELSAWYRNQFPPMGWTLDVPPVDNTQPVQLITFTKDVRIVDVSLVTQPDTGLSEITLDFMPGLVTEGDE
jgi:hypothetical protein